MKKKLLILLVCVLMAVGLAACGTKVESYSFGDYTYTNPETEQHDWRDLKGDADMTVDGVLDEAHYTGLHSLDFTTGYDEDVEIGVVAHMGETGVYVGVTVQDDYLYYNPQRTVFNNTSVELHIAQADAQTLSKDVIQLRYGINGYTEQWIGVTASDGYAYNRAYVATMARVRLTGQGAAINSRVEGQGFVLEAFVPYKSFGLSAKPEEVKIGPAYNHVRDANTSNSERLHKDAPGMSYTDPVSFAVFDKDGYNKGQSEALATEKEIDGDLSDWDDATVNENNIKLLDKDENGKSVEFRAYLGSDGLYLMADAIHGKYVDNNASWFNNTNFELFINGGGGDNDAWHRWVTPARAANTGMSGGLAAMKTVDSQVADAADRYHTTVEAFLPFRAIPGYAEGATNVRVGFAFKTPGDLMKAGHETNPAGGTGLVSTPGGPKDADDWWFPKGHTPNNVSQQYFVMGGGIFDKLPVTPSLTIDADLSDWTNATVNANASVVKAPDSDKGFTVRAFTDEKGLYIGYEAKHALYKTAENDWFQNTNAEIQLFGGNQSYINAKDQVSMPIGSYAEMKTTDSGTADAVDRYTTVVEIFIPNYALEAFGYNPAMGYVKAGFAFKTGGDTLAQGGNHPSGLNGSDWWWAKNHSPSNIAEQYYVTADGIFATLDSMPAITLDGDFADWEALSNAAAIKDSKIAIYDTDAARVGEFGACGYTVYAFATEHGLYAYYDVTHHINPVDNSKPWHENPNAEIFVTGKKGGDPIQCFVSARPETKNMAAFFKTTEVPANEGEGVKHHFKTVAEIFIPYFVYGGAKDDGTVTAKLCWKINAGEDAFDDLTVEDAAVWESGNLTDSWWAVLRNVGANGMAA